MQYNYCHNTYGIFLYLRIHSQNWENSIDFTEDLKLVENLDGDLKGTIEFMQASSIRTDHAAKNHIIGDNCKSGNYHFVYDEQFILYDKRAYLQHIK